RRFAGSRNVFGRVAGGADLHLRGRLEEPWISGDVTIDAGDLKVDEILEQVLFQPYGTEPVSIADVDAVAALNPWERLGVDLAVHVPNTLKLNGENVKISPGKPVGSGRISL